MRYRVPLIYLYIQLSESFFQIFPRLSSEIIRNMFRPISHRREFFFQIFPSLVMIEYIHQDTEAFCHNVWEFLKSKKIKKVKLHNVMLRGKNQENLEICYFREKIYGNCEEKSSPIWMTLYPLHPVYITRMFRGVFCLEKCLLII